MRDLLRFVGLVLSVTSGGCLVGCANANTDITQDQQEARLDNTMSRLEDANFVGDIDVQSDSGGSVLGAHARQSVWLGPAESTLHVKAKGKVDYTQLPRVKPAPATPAPK
jgi:hypothetical protein